MLQARELGLTCVGITGGETFMLPWLPEALAEIGGIMPTIVLTNATLFTDRMLDRLEPLSGSDVALQISLDSDEPERNDEWRRPRQLREGARRHPQAPWHAASASASPPPSSARPTTSWPGCATLHRSLGISDDDHVVRTVVRRGRAASGGWASSWAPTTCCPS